MASSADAWRPLKISVQNLIRDFLEMYTAEPEEVVLTESIANSLDARSTDILIGLDDVDDDEEEGGATVFSIADNGAGMTREAFENSYHGLALSSKAKGEAIGFAGVGAKLYLAMLGSGNRIYTETRSASFSGASEFGIVDEEAVWRNVPPRGKLGPDSTGTYVEVKLRRRLQRDRAEEAIRSNYDAILQGLYGPITIRLAWGREPLRSSLPVSKADTRTFSVGRRGCTARFWLSDHEAESPQGLDIVVLGKRIRSRERFNLQFDVKPEALRRIGGMVVADPLAPLLTTNKQDLRMGNETLWQEFRTKARSEFKRWLRRVDAIQSLTRVGESDLVLTNQVARTVNEVLRLPALGDYAPWLEDPWAQDPWSPLSRRTSAVGPRPRSEALVARRPSQHSGRSLASSGARNEPGRGAGSEGTPGLSIRLAHRPNQTEEAWVDADGVVVNAGHPVFRRSRSGGRAAEATHMMRCVFMALIENKDPSKKEILDELRGFYNGWASLRDQRGDRT